MLSKSRMSNIRLKTISVEPGQSPLVVGNGDMYLTATTPSASRITGTLVSNGGIGINCTIDSTCSTLGGALTIGGGASVGKTIQAGGNIVMDTSIGVLQVKGLSDNRFFLDSSINGICYIAPDGVNRRMQLTDTQMSVNVSAPSTGASTGAVFVAGGITIGCTTDAVNTTGGGGLSIAGGASVTKSIFVGKGISSINSNTIGTLFTTGGNVGIGNASPGFTLDVNGTFNVTGDCNVSGSMFGSGSSASTYAYLTLTATDESINLSTGSLVTFGGITTQCDTDATSPTCGGALLTQGGAAVGKRLWVGTGIASLSSNTIGNLFTTAGNVGIGTTAPAYSLDVNGSARINGGGSVLVDRGTAVGGKSHIVLRSTSGTQMMAMGLDGATAGNFSIWTYDAAGNNLSKAIDINRFSSITTFVGANSGSTNTMGPIITTGGSVGIGTTSPGVTFDVVGTARVTSLYVQNGSWTSNSNDVFINANNNNIFLRPTSGSGTNQVQLSPTGTLSVTGSTESTTTSSGALVISGGMGVVKSVTIGGGLSVVNASSTIGSIVTTGGNVGIKTTSPTATVDIKGTLGVSGIITFTNTTSSSNSSTGTLVLGTGGIGINSTVDAGSVTSGGGLTVAGGAAVRKSLWVGGRTQFLDGTASTSYGVGSVLMAGGLTISANDNASNIGNGGALTVAGGASVGGDLYVGGSINGSGSSSSTYAYLTLTATDEAINMTTGTLVTFGGITIQCTTNASSITNGGSLLVNGGGSFGGDVYISGTTQLYNPTNYYNVNAKSNVINLFDGSLIKRFSIDLNVASNSFSVSRYNSLGAFVEKVIEASNAGGVVFYNSTGSSSLSAAGIVSYGGISIACTQNAVGAGNGGALTVGGGASVGGDMYVRGNVSFLSTTSSSSATNGSVVFSGGVGILNNLNVGGNTVINGNLTVNGTTMSVDSTNTNIGDNLIVLNSGPSGSKDGGILVQRFQTDNNGGSGDVVNDTLYTTIALPDQTGMSNTNVKLSASASNVDNYYTGWWVKVASGFSTNQVRKITAYNGTTKIATISSVWNTQNPAIGDTVYLYNKAYVGVFYSELNDRFEFGGSVSDPGQTNVTITDRIPISFSKAYSLATDASSNPTSGALLLSGGLSIANTTDALSLTSGGTLTSLGGGSFNKSLMVGTQLWVGGVQMTPNPKDVFTAVSFTAANNQVSPVNVTGIAFDNTVWGGDIYLVAQIIATVNSYTNFHIRVVNKGGSWDLIKTYIGDDTGINFYITSSGQLQYTSPNIPGFVSIIFRARALVV